MRFMAALVLLCLAGFTGTALAADAVSSTDPSLLDAAKAVFDAVVHGQWWAAAALVVVLLCAGARRYMPAAWKTGTKGDIVGTGLAFLIASAGAIATVMLAPGAAMTAGVALTALKIGVAAIGGYTLIHKALGWLSTWGLLPSWAAPILKALAALIGSNAIKKAETAGDKAVAAEPPKGLAGDTQVHEVE